MFSIDKLILLNEREARLRDLSAFKYIEMIKLPKKLIQIYYELTDDADMAACKDS
jgi:hypothetical protein